VTGERIQIVLTSPFVLFHNVTCYNNFIVSHIHVNTTNLCNITCTLFGCHMCHTTEFRVYKMVRKSKLRPQARSHLCSVGSRPSHASFIARSSYPHLCRNSFPLGTNVTIPCNLNHQTPLACERNSWINLGIMKVMST
jgi:hypothetical protein